MASCPNSDSCVALPAPTAPPLFRSKASPLHFLFEKNKKGTGMARNRWIEPFIFFSVLKMKYEIPQMPSAVLFGEPWVTRAFYFVPVVSISFVSYTPHPTHGAPPQIPRLKYNYTLHFITISHRCTRLPNFQGTCTQFRCILRYYTLFGC